MASIRYTPSSENITEALLGNTLPVEKSNVSPQYREIVNGIIQPAVKAVAEALPDTNFAILGAYNIIVPEILSYLTGYALPEPPAISSTWNYLDATCQGLTGLQQLFNKATHRPLVTKAKGLFNLASTTQVITLTALSSVSLGPISFAVASGTLFLQSLDEVIRQMRRLWSSEYYFVDTLKELDKIEELILIKEKSLEELSQLPEDQQNSGSGKWAIRLATDALNQLKKRRDLLQRRLETVFDADLYRNKVYSRLYPIAEDYDVRRLHTEAGRNFLRQLLKRPIPSNAEYHGGVNEAERAIRKQTKTALIHAIADSTLWAMAFTGMLLACIPGAQIVALVIITTASILLVVKNRKKIAAKAKQIYKLFKDPSPAPAEPEPTRGLEAGASKPPAAQA